MDDTNTHYSVLAELLTHTQKLHLSPVPSPTRRGETPLPSQGRGWGLGVVVTHKVLHNIGLYIEPKMSTAFNGFYCFSELYF